MCIPDPEFRKDPDQDAAPGSEPNITQFRFAKLLICPMFWSIEVNDFFNVLKGALKIKDQEQCCGSGSETGSVLDPYAGALWIRIRIQNADPNLDPHM